MSDSAGHANPLDSSALEFSQVQQQADAARKELEVIRKTLLALAQGMPMDFVLDSMLHCVLDLIPYDSAGILLTDDISERLFVAREFPRRPSSNELVVTIETTGNALLHRIIFMKKSVHISDTREEADWKNAKPFMNSRCWIGVPLRGVETIHGLLSICGTRPHSFTAEHFRMAKLLAIPMGIAIHNARLYELAYIYAEERKSLLRQLERKSTERLRTFTRRLERNLQG
jgi:transcriptional regulator with GAF, ATPase, and Fis domain